MRMLTHLLRVEATRTVYVTSACPTDVGIESASINNESSEFIFPFQLILGAVHLYTNEPIVANNNSRFCNEIALNKNAKSNESTPSSLHEDNQERRRIPRICRDDVSDSMDAEIIRANTSQSPFERDPSPNECSSTIGNCDKGGVSRKWQCALLGLPHEMILEDLHSFLEPYGHEIAEVIVVQSIDDSDDSDDPFNTLLNKGGSASSDSIKASKLCIIDFSCKDTMQSFYFLYNGLHFPSHDFLPPCLTLQLSECTVEYKDRIESHFERIPCPTPELPKNTTVELPTCCVCLRRLSTEVSGVHVYTASSRMSERGNEYSVGPDYTGNLNRCKVCSIYGSSSLSTLDSSNRKRCQVCHITENIWVCLLCGFAGCGRYSAQHAKNHFHSAGHPFSLEIVTGRIWSYVGDRFVHEDIFSEYMRDPIAPASQRSGDNTAPPWKTSSRGERRDEDAVVSELMQRLDLHTSDKLGALQHDYDGVLDMQLKEQELYYEKLIARETVQLLELGCLWDGVEDVSSSCEESATYTSMTEDDLAEIEALKLEISAIEYNYQEQLRELCQEESATAAVRQDNNQLLQHQKSLRAKISERNARANEIREKESSQVASLQQDIRDMEFFLRTSEELSNAAPEIQNDVREGVVTIGEAKKSKSGHRKHGKKRK